MPVLMRPYAKPAPAFAADACVTLANAAGAQRFATRTSRGAAVLGKTLNQVGGQAFVLAVVSQDITRPSPGPWRKPECRRN
ncbi:hypothetical protein IP84_02580 [beta proteobacterium AAP99]|nr:hypothetical protein IP84_02580 [beta proteobacterium AAP99]